MKKSNILLSALLLLWGFSQAQTPIHWEKVTLPHGGVYYDYDFKTMWQQKQAFVDIDGDGDEDLFSAGGEGAGFYINDGAGNFSLYSDSSFATFDESMYVASFIFTDIDGDNDLDFFMSGEQWDNNGSYNFLSEYRNDGSGSFSLQSNNINPMNGKVTVADVDGDNDPDLICIGKDSTNNQKGQLYLNDGNGNLSELANANIPYTTATWNIQYSTHFFDADNDNDLDLVFYNKSNHNIEIYTNDGTGVFSSLINLGNHYNATISLMDRDNDNDLDLFVTYDNGVKEFVNNGGAFSNQSVNTVDNLGHPTHLWLDVDGDNVAELLHSGRDNNTNEYFTYIYRYDSIGVYTKIDTLWGVNGWNGTLIESDIDGDNDLDFVACGDNGQDAVNEFFINDGTGSFHNPQQSPFSDVSWGDMEFCDVDGDNDLDVVIIGYNNGDHSNLYLNDGNANFEVDTTFSAKGYEGQPGTITFKDFDGDNDEDLLIFGYNDDDEPGVEYFYNDGLGNFSLDTTNMFMPLEWGTTSTADIDGDNDLDIIVTGGDTNDFTPRTCIYLNNGSGQFSLQIGTTFSLAYAISSVGDIDGDQDIDLILSGEDTLNNWNPTTEVYLNDGNGNFSLQSGNVFPGMAWGAQELTDMDNDGDLDLLIAGNDSSWNPSTSVYFNDGLGNFTANTNHNLPYFNECRSEMEDMNGDGFIDLFLSGDDSNSTSVSKLYLNDGTGNFQELQDLPLTQYSTLELADVNNDATLDLLVTGLDKPYTRLFLNMPSCTNDSTFSSISSCNNYNWNGQLITSSGTYSQVFSNVAGCDSTHYLTVNINTGSTYNQQFDICEGDSIVVGASTYTLAGTYTDVLSAANGCDSTVTTALAVNPNPSIPVITQLFSTTLETGVFDAYQWYRNGVALAGETNQQLNIVQGGYYTVEVFNANGCSSFSAEFAIGVSALEDLAADELKVFPNPTNGHITLATNGLNNYHVHIYDFMGRKVFTFENKEQLSSPIIKLDELAPANYKLVVLFEDGKRWSTTINKQ
jgi:hypothetical protein